jgi:AcrR family transcriptional regulator
MTRTLSLDVRAALNDAVDKVVYAEGAHIGCVDSICEQAGVGKPAFYRHFGSRDGMLIDYLRRRREQQCALIEQAIAQAGPSRDRRVLAIVNWIADWIESEEFVGCGFHRAMLQRPLGLDELREVTLLQKTWLQNLLTRELGLSSTNIAIARHLFLLTEGAMATAMYEPDRRSGDDLRLLAKQILQQQPKRRPVTQ